MTLNPISGSDSSNEALPALQKPKEKEAIDSQRIKRAIGDALSSSKASVWPKTTRRHQKKMDTSIFERAVGENFINSNAQTKHHYHRHHIKKGLPSSLGIAFGRLRQMADLSQHDAGIIFGCCAAQISYIQNGVRNIPPNSRVDLFYRKYDLYSRSLAKIDEAIQELIAKKNRLSLKGHFIERHPKVSEKKEISPPADTPSVESAKGSEERSSECDHDSSDSSPLPTPLPSNHLSFSNRNSFPYFLFGTKVLRVEEYHRDGNILLYQSKD